MAMTRAINSLSYANRAENFSTIGLLKKAMVDLVVSKLPLPQFWMRHTQLQMAAENVAWTKQVRNLLPSSKNQMLLVPLCSTDSTILLFFK